MQMSYSVKFKQSIVKKLTGPKPASKEDLADSVGVHASTLSRWVRELGSVDGMSKKKIKSLSIRPDDRSPEEKLCLILEASQLSDDKIGSFLRKTGVHEADLNRWRGEALQGLANKPAKAASRAPEVKRIKELERELRRKDRALAETAALIVLKKKAAALWGDGDDSTE